MKRLKSDWLIILFILTPILPLLFFWNDFPDRFATHFNFDGEPNGYSSKIGGLLILPGMNILFYFLFLALPKLDPSGKNYALFESSYKIIRLAIHAFLSFMLIVIIGFALGYNPNMSLLINYSVLLLMLVFGNYMGTIRPNYFIGVKTPWTLASPEVWKKTHQLTGKVWVIGSLVTMIFVPFSKAALFIGIVIMAFIPIIYSYIEFKKLEQSKHNSL